MQAPDSPLPVFKLDQFDAIIFDLGGVILPLEYGATVRELSRLLSIDASKIYTQARQSEIFDSFERGEITVEAFRDALLGELEGSELAGSRRRRIESAQLDAAWNALLGHVPLENVHLLRKLAAEKRLFLLSNTNEIHLQRFLADFNSDHAAEGPFGSLFERAYYSHEMGFRKPESRIYQQLLDTHGLVAERTLFLDDNHDNIAGARALGIRAEHHPSNFPLTARFAT